MKKLLPVLFALIGIWAGVGAGIVLRPVPEAEHIVAESETETAEVHSEEEESTKEYVKLNNQFVVPVIQGARVGAMVVMSLSVEVPQGKAEKVYAKEPKLRDMFLQVLFDHANVGGFDGAFTQSSTLDVLRRSLLEASYHAVGDLVSDVLITDIARQDV